MKTECREQQLEFQGIGTRKVVAEFDGGTITSDAGALLLSEADRKYSLLKRFAGCFVDHRDSRLIEHSVEQLVAQRVIGLCLSYEDLNDHEFLRKDPLLAVVCGQQDIQGQRRRRERDRGSALAGKSTLNRLELAATDGGPRHRYRKIVARPYRIDELLIDVFLEQYREPPEEIVLDVDATDDALHGNQEGRFFNGYYDQWCYLPLYIFCGQHLLHARLRRSDCDPLEGLLPALAMIYGKVASRWPETRIVVRGDSGFCRAELMDFCERRKIEYVVGLAKNSVVLEMLAPAMAMSKRDYLQEVGATVRRYADLHYRTTRTWSRARRVVGKAEYSAQGENPRFVVTSFSSEEFDAQTVYEQKYCARGDMENRIKEQQLYLFADRTSTALFKANQLRLWFSSIAYVLMHLVRSIGCAGTDFATAQCHSLRLRLLKIGALVKVSVRRVTVHMPSGYPYQDQFRRIYANLVGLSP